MNGHRSSIENDPLGISPLIGTSIAGYTPEESEVILRVYNHIRRQQRVGQGELINEIISSGKSEERATRMVENAKNLGLIHEEKYYDKSLNADARFLNVRAGLDQYAYAALIGERTPEASHAEPPSRPRRAPLPVFEPPASVVRQIAEERRPEREQVEGASKSKKETKAKAAEVEAKKERHPGDHAAVGLTWPKVKKAYIRYDTLKDMAMELECTAQNVRQWLERHDVPKEIPLARLERREIIQKIEKEQKEKETKESHERARSPANLPSRSAAPQEPRTEILPEDKEKGKPGRQRVIPPDAVLEAFLNPSGEDVARRLKVSRKIISDNLLALGLRRKPNGGPETFLVDPSLFPPGTSSGLAKTLTDRLILIDRQLEQLTTLTTTMHQNDAAKLFEKLRTDLKEGIPKIAEQLRRDRADTEIAEARKHVEIARRFAPEEYVQWGVFGRTATSESTRKKSKR
ncbi:MAG TPA: hypothetical protein VL944_02580 [Candidatus Acidoferrum sp.]|nr:hypothetical protein [Candidatus Acidoferrum sp.]